MNNIKTVIVLLAILVSFSCESNLEEVPESFLEESNSYNSADDANSAINAVYARLDGIYGMTMINLADLNGDELKTREDNSFGNEIHNNLFNSGSQLFDSFYTNSYILIDRANRVIENVPGISMNEEEKNSIVGEAKFLRALAYFNLVRAFGDIPLVNSVTNDIINVQLPRANTEEIYGQIIADLTDAEASLPIRYSASNKIGRATKGAAQSILAKVFLTQKNWQKAFEKSKEIVDSGVYGLFPNYRDVFLPENENGIEHIFSVQYSCTLPQYGSSMAVNFAIYFSYPVNLIGGSYEATPEHAASYLEGDYRKDVTIINSKTIADGTVVPSRTGPHVDKYWDPLACGSQSARNDFMVIRYADVLLMYAEALNEISGPTPEAYRAINEIRNRARNGNPESDVVDLANLTKEQFRDAILQERSWELCYEGHRRWDLLRTGKYIETKSEMGVIADQKHLLYPIPIREIDVNSALVQNPGY